MLSIRGGNDEGSHDAKKERHKRERESFEEKPDTPYEVKKGIFLSSLCIITSDDQKKMVSEMSLGRRIASRRRTSEEAKPHS